MFSMPRVLEMQQSMHNSVRWDHEGTIPLDVEMVCTCSARGLYRPILLGV